MHRRSPARALAAVLGLVTAVTVGMPGAQAGDRSPLVSAVTGIEATTTQLTLAGASWTRTVGTVSGVVDPREQVAGLAGLPVDAAGRHHYTSEFEVLAPTGATRADLVLVEAENRGSPLVLGALQDLTLPVGSPTSPRAINWPPGLGNGFLQSVGVSYARVQWETGISAGVPATAQGIGEVITRDFGRLLEGTDRGVADRRGLPVFGASLLAGVSQSAWFVNTLVDEGFNADPRTGRRVFDGALAVDGTGNRLAINRLAGTAPQQPYLLPDGVPVTIDQLLTRHRSDPLYVDVANYTDFYRLRASVSDQAPRRPDARRYDWPSPHAGTSFPDAVVFGLLRCNDGSVVPRNPIDYRPHLRTLVTQFATALTHPGAGARRALPPSALFELTAAPAASATFNALPGVALSVPRVDPDTAQPLGGVRFPEATVPLGRPLPVALPPVSTRNILDVCGNWGGWQPFTAGELATRYGTVDDYLARYAAAVDEQVRQGYLRAEERAPMLDAARAAFLSAPA
ncbi:alpha/beta hydrolase domain-containing protein [Goekera deserti]|uniref:Alpha/beta hydrolase domain-containing protein n=1 Tax=Goekera deserti TaxID=2497753 RepID=A0A7K3WC72_9ACTN|nr:alpha/beta hydrolase domain-containing protein [Goekera deserti]NDI48319.1 hypothetical protein [Goekera deserti]NEL54068.1 hypothetical protein [Goekera deserti]